jgi:hypothetical protein
VDIAPRNHANTLPQTHRGRECIQGVAPLDGVHRPETRTRPCLGSDDLLAKPLHLELK